MIDAVNSILDEEKKVQQLDEASAFDWKANKNETDPKFTTKKPGERTGHESKKTDKGVQYTKKPVKAEVKESFKDKLLALKNAQRQIQTESKTFDELLEDLNEEQVDKLIFEVLGKDADAGDYIHDFIHSKNSKFAGKSKEERKKMALGAYYGKHNEEVKDEYARKVDKYLKKKYNKEESHQSATTMKHIPNPSPALKKAAKDIKPGIAGYRDRIDMLKAGGVKEEANKESKKDFQDRQQRLATAGAETAKDPARLKRLSNIPGYSAAMDLAKKTTKEEVEELDELSKSTLGSYLDKKKSEYMKGKTQSGSKENAKDIQNMGKAHDKMNKEELIGGQKKLDKNHNGKLDGQDFKILRGQKNEGVMDTAKKVGGKLLNVMGHGSDEDMKKDLQKKMGMSQNDVSTDTLAGRVQGGAPNQHSSHKIKLKAEAVEKDNKPPFDGPYTKVKGTVKDKSGAEHTPMSRARHLAKQAMSKVKTEMLGKAGGTSE